MSKAEAMGQAVAKAKAACDSVGGIVECAAIGLPAGVGEPFFDSVESTLSAHLFFRCPGVKGAAFVLGLPWGPGTASQCNDPYIWKNGQVETTTNHNGGVLGGLTNGMPVVSALSSSRQLPSPKSSTHRFVKAENRGNAGSKGAA